MLRLNCRGDKPGFIVRLLSPLGSYPAESFIGKDERMMVGPDLCFTVTKSRVDDSFSEIDRLEPVEIPLLGTILLCTEKDQFSICPYPAYTSLHLYSRAGTDVTDEMAAEARRLLLAAICRKRSRGDWPTSPAHLPPLGGGSSAYHLIEGPERVPVRAHLLPLIKSVWTFVLSGFGAAGQSKHGLPLPGVLGGGWPYEYSHGSNPRAAIALAAGVSAALIGLLLPVLRPLYDCAWFVGFFLSGGLYTLLMKAQNPPQV